jgi:hypothetical protein
MLPGPRMTIMSLPLCLTETNSKAGTVAPFVSWLLPQSGHNTADMAKASFHILIS